MANVRETTFDVNGETNGGGEVRGDRDGAAKRGGRGLQETIRVALEDGKAKTFTITDGVLDPTGGTIRLCYKYVWDRGPATSVKVVWTKRDGSGTFDDEIDATNTKETACRCDTAVSEVTLTAVGGDAQVKRVLC